MSWLCHVSHIFLSSLMSDWTFDMLSMFILFGTQHGLLFIFHWFLSYFKTIMQLLQFSLKVSAKWYGGLLAFFHFPQSTIVLFTSQSNGLIIVVIIFSLSSFILMIGLIGVIVFLVCSQACLCMICNGLDCYYNIV